MPLLWPRSTSPASQDGRNAYFKKCDDESIEMRTVVLMNYRADGFVVDLDDGPMILYLLRQLEHHNLNEFDYLDDICAFVYQSTIKYNTVCPLLKNIAFSSRRDALAAIEMYDLDRRGRDNRTMHESAVYLAADLSSVNYQDSQLFQPIEEPY